MNAWQVFKQVRKLLEDQVWPDSGGESVFGNVVISVAPEERALRNMRMPVVMIVPLDAEADPQFDEEEGMILQNIGIKIIQAIAGDPVGQSVLVGGYRGLAGQSKSAGRGLLEIEEPMLDSISQLNEIDGISIMMRYKSAVEHVLDDIGYVAWRDYTFEALVTSTRFYHTAEKLTAVDVGNGGDITLSWELPPSRFDLLRVILRRASGSTAPSTPTSGTGVTLSGNLATGVTDSTGAPGQYSYALFAAYDETNDTPSVEQRFSASVTTTITAT